MKPLETLKLDKYLFGKNRINIFDEAAEAKAHSVPFVSSPHATFESGETQFSSIVS